MRWLSAPHPIFLLGDAIGHVRQMVIADNFAPGNAGVPLYGCDLPSARHCPFAGCKMAKRHGTNFLILHTRIYYDCVTNQMEAQHVRGFPARTTGPPSPQTPRHCWAFEFMTQSYYHCADQYLVFDARRCGVKFAA
jgi:hypothetical protein